MGFSTLRADHNPPLVVRRIVIRRQPGWPLEHGSSFAPNTKPRSPGSLSWLKSASVGQTGRQNQVPTGALYADVLLLQLPSALIRIWGLRPPCGCSGSMRNLQRKHPCRREAQASDAIHVVPWRPPRVCADPRVGQAPRGLSSYAIIHLTWWWRKQQRARTPATRRRVCRNLHRLHREGLGLLGRNRSGWWRLSVATWRAFEVP
jgi:hypothetical protein